MFGPLKEAMGGKKFRADEEVQQAVQESIHFVNAGGPEMETM
jgi:hypothetical protein